jgi:hypothetical protein
MLKMAVIRETGGVTFNAIGIREREKRRDFSEYDAKIGVKE